MPRVFHVSSDGGDIIMNGIKKLQLTFAIIKPDVAAVPHLVQSIHKTILGGGFYFIRSKKTVIDINEATRFYKEHSKKFFYTRLLSFISSGPSYVHILAKENAIKEWRELMGPTKSYKTTFTHPDSIRGTYGLSDTRNATHGSDSPESATREINIFFPYFSIPDWYENEEKKFRMGKCYFNEEEFVHELLEKREPEFESKKA